MQMLKNALPVHPILTMSIRGFPAYAARRARLIDPIYAVKVFLNKSPTPSIPVTIVILQLILRQFSHKIETIGICSENLGGCFHRVSLYSVCSYQGPQLHRRCSCRWVQVQHYCVLGHKLGADLSGKKIAAWHVSSWKVHGTVPTHWLICVLF